MLSLIMEIFIPGYENYLGELEQQFQESVDSTRPKGFFKIQISNC